MLYLPENLKKYRILKNLTQEDVAEYLRITPQSVSKWERGESYPDITLLPALANIFETSIDLLVLMEKANNSGKKGKNKYKYNISDHLALGYGSKYQLLRMLGWHREEFNEIIAGIPNVNIVWKDFEWNGSEDKELMNANFLGKEIESEWETLWATNGGRNGLNWDAVAFDGKTWYLVEAKAHLTECDSKTKGGGKAPEGQKKIKNAISNFQTKYKIITNNDWTDGNIYQIANRLVFLDFLKEKGIDAKLVYVLFLNGYEFNSRNNKSVRSKEEWEGKFSGLLSKLGIKGTEVEQMIQFRYVDVDRKVVKLT